MNNNTIADTANQKFRVGMWYASSGRLVRATIAPVWAGQMLKKNSGMATMYLRLNTQRSPILIGSDNIDRNSSIKV